MPKPQTIAWKRIAAEAAAIVVSILLAFAIDAWWGNRNERKSLKGHLSAFEEELLESRREIDRVLSKSVGVLRTTDEVFKILTDTSESELPETFPQTIGSIYKIHTPVLTSGAYEDMVNSDYMRLINDRNLSVEIVQYKQMLSTAQSVNQLLWETY